MGKTTTDAPAVEKGDEHLSARIDEDSYRRIRIAAAERDESIAEFLRETVGMALAELEEGNPKPNRAARASS